MSSRSRPPHTRPTHVDQIRPGDPYEFSEGRAIDCSPTGTDGTAPNGFGFAVLDSDPAVKRTGVDTGVALPGALRAPDVAVNFEAGDGTWATKVPLAVEYAGKGQDEAELKLKIHELLRAGTQYVWVVRLVGPRRVEVYEKGAPARIASANDELTAPGVLALPVPVRALFDRSAAHEITLRNLLAEKGYADLEALREEGREAGLRTAVTTACELLAITLDEAQQAWIATANGEALTARLETLRTTRRWV
jgi:Uma2 family endonuclease